MPALLKNLHDITPAVQSLLTFRVLGAGLCAWADIQVGYCAEIVL